MTIRSRGLHKSTQDSPLRQVTHFPERICITYIHRDKLQKPWPGAEVETLSNSHRIKKRVSHSSFSVSVSCLVLLKHIEMTVTVFQDGYLLFKIIIFLVHMFGLPDSQETKRMSAQNCNLNPFAMMLSYTELGHILNKYLFLFQDLMSIFLDAFGFIG